MRRAKKSRIEFDNTTIKGVDVEKMVVHNQKLLIIFFPRKFSLLSYIICWLNLQGRVAKGK